MFINTDSKFIWMNGEFLKWDETKVHALTHTLHYGVGVFEGVRAYKNDLGGAIFRLDDHTRRLFDAASKVNIDIPYSIEDLNQIQKDTLKQNKLEEAYIRPIVFLVLRNWDYERAIFQLMLLLLVGSGLHIWIQKRKKME